MVCAEMDLQEFQNWTRMRGIEDHDQAMHCLLTECLGREMAPKPFRVMTGRGNRNGLLYGYGQNDAETLRETMETFGNPLQLRAIHPGGIKTKNMPTGWTPRKRLGFEARVRPVVRSRLDLMGKVRTVSDGEKVRITQYDAFIRENQALEEGQRKHTREEAYTNWVSRELKRHGGCHLEGGISIRSFRWNRAVRKHNQEGTQGPDVLIQGTVVVTDPAVFDRFLARGIGRHRAYGYGMVLLHPPGPH